jgi:hypothetical protein
MEGAHCTTERRERRERRQIRNSIVWMLLTGLVIVA